MTLKNLIELHWATFFWESNTLVCLHGISNTLFVFMVHLFPNPLSMAMHSSCWISLMWLRLFDVYHSNHHLYTIKQINHLCTIKPFHGLTGSVDIVKENLPALRSLQIQHYLDHFLSYYMFLFDLAKNACCMEISCLTELQGDIMHAEYVCQLDPTQMYMS